MTAHHGWRRAAAIALLALAFAPTAAQAGERRADARLDEAIRAAISQPLGPPAVAALVQRGDQVRNHSFGRANLEAPGPIRPRLHMRIASVTKAFTGAVLLRLVEKNRLKLGTTVGAVRPELPASWHPITLRQLLYHTSGLPNYTATPAFQAYFPAHLADFISVQQIVDFGASEPIEFPPGARYAYSNTDNIVMALMAERATGRQFSALLKALVLRPLGLRDTRFSAATAMPSPFVRGYVYDGPGDPLVEVTELISPSGTWAAGMIVSTQRDLNAFIRAWGGGGLLRSARARRAQTRFLPPFTAGQPPGPGQNRGGLTLFRYRTPCGVVYGHSGNFPGYTQWIASSPDGTRSAVVSANLQLDVETGTPGVFPFLRRVYRRAACAALAG
ncbi:MAG: serine hydrolase domain-containing protein [Solirubrobacterales bacterium]